MRAIAARRLASWRVRTAGNAFSLSVLQPKADSISWASIQQKQAAVQRIGDRRIEFPLAKKPANAFLYQATSSVDMTSKSDRAMGSVLKTTTKKDLDCGLFDPKIVEKFMQWQKISRVGPGLINFGQSCKPSSLVGCDC